MRSPETAKRKMTKPTIRRRCRSRSMPPILERDIQFRSTSPMILRVPKGGYARSGSRLTSPTSYPLIGSIFGLNDKSLKGESCLRTHGSEMNAYGGQWLEFHLRDVLPRQGENLLEIVLESRAKGLVSPLKVEEVELIVEYGPYPLCVAASVPVLVHQGRGQSQHQTVRENWNPDRSTGGAP